MDSDPGRADPADPGGASVGSWAPRRAETVGAALGALLTILLAVTSDAAGQLLFGLAAALLAGVAATDLLLGPRLRVDPAGLEVRTLFVRRRLPWSAVDRVAVDERARYGLTARTLEVDGDELLVVLGRRSLGTDPRDVAERIARLRTGW